MNCWNNLCAKYWESVVKTKIWEWVKKKNLFSIFFQIFFSHFCRVEFVFFPSKKKLIENFQKKILKVTITKKKIFYSSLSWKFMREKIPRLKIDFYFVRVFETRSILPICEYTVISFENVSIFFLNSWSLDSKNGDGQW